jgi:transcriptional regulator with XRE-family HTH domain
MHRGLSLEAAADAAQITHGTLSRIERGLVPYNQDLLENLALLYGCDPAELLVQNPAEASRIVQLWEHADTGQRRAIAAVGESLTGYRAEDDQPRVARRR